MSKPERAERVCENHCIHGFEYMRHGVCIMPVGMDACMHRCQPLDLSSAQPEGRHEFKSGCVVTVKGTMEICGLPRSASVHQADIASPAHDQPLGWGDGRGPITASTDACSTAESASMRAARRIAFWSVDGDASREPDAKAVNEIAAIIEEEMRIK